MGWQVDGAMTPEELEKYECVEDAKGHAEWWGNFNGPCCRPKPNAKASNVLSQRQVAQFGW